jgi:hypothetical protein
MGVTNALDQAIQDAVERALEARFEPLIQRVEQAVATVRLAQLDGEIKLSRNDAAKYIGVAPITLAMWATEGKGPSFIKLGDSPNSPVRYLKSEIKRWLEANRLNIDKPSRKRHFGPNALKADWRQEATQGATA